MFDDIETVCRAAACLTFADGRDRYVYKFGGDPIITTIRPQREHTEIRRSGEINNLVMGVRVRPYPAGMHPAAVNGIAYNDAAGHWLRDVYNAEYLVFDRCVDGDLLAIQEPTQALWRGRNVNWRETELFGGFIVRATAVFQIGPHNFTLLEDGDGDEFLVEGVKLCSAIQA